VENNVAFSLVLFLFLFLFLLDLIGGNEADVAI